MFDYFLGKFIQQNETFIKNIFHFSMHASGERLGQLTGIAAILRFPMPDLDLSEDHHHQHHNEHDEANGDRDDIDNDDIPANPNRTVNHFNQPNEDRTINNSERLNENRAEASAW